MSKLERSLNRARKYNEKSVKAAAKESRKLGGVWVPCILKVVDVVTPAVFTRDQAT